jgi:hypothetical protein
MAVKGVENLKITAPASDIIIPEDAVAAISSAEIAEVARL